QGVADRQRGQHHQRGRCARARLGCRRKAVGGGGGRCGRAQAVASRQSAGSAFGKLGRRLGGGRARVPGGIGPAAIVGRGRLGGARGIGLRRRSAGGGLLRGGGRFVGVVRGLAGVIG